MKSGEIENLMVCALGQLSTASSHARSQEPCPAEPGAWLFLAWDPEKWMKNHTNLISSKIIEAE